MPPKQALLRLLPCHHRVHARQVLPCLTHHQHPSPVNLPCPFLTHHHHLGLVPLHQNLRLRPHHRRPQNMNKSCRRDTCLMPRVLLLPECHRQRGSRSPAGSPGRLSTRPADHGTDSAALLHADATTADECIRLLQRTATSHLCPAGMLFWPLNHCVA